MKNYNIVVKKRGSEIVFLRKIVPGAADRSYGVEVAKLAGLPDKVVNRARDLLKELEQNAPAPRVLPQNHGELQLSMDSLTEDHLRKRLEAISIDTLTPIEALNLLYELKKML